MTIKEIEELAEMPRANIRFYEAEGLLSPARSVNGYRDYSQEDLSVLKKIKLLRSLHMSLEEIKALHTGKQELSVALEQQISKLSSDKEKLHKAQIVCESMYRDGTNYNNLDAEKYLWNLKHGVNTHATSAKTQQFSWESYWDTREAYEDTLPTIQAPWRRFFARTLDEAFYTIIWYCFLILVFDMNLANRGSGARLLDILMTLLFTIVLEPLQLTLFGTTLGKWILGLHVWHNDDRKLTFSEALERTKQVLFYGLGFHIPIFEPIRMWKSYKACTERESLTWEYDSRIILKGEQTYRTVIYLGVHTLFVGVVLCANVLVQIPLHRGELEIPQFCQNYRELARYYGVSSGYTLSNHGEWRDTTPGGESVVIYALGLQAPPAFVFETDADEKIQKISFTVEYHISQDTPKDDRPWVSSFQTQMQLAALSFVGARDEFPHFSLARRKMLQTITSHGFEDYSFTEAGVTVTCDVEHKGYHLAGVELLLPSDEGECSFYMNFTMSVEE